MIIKHDDFPHYVSLFKYTIWLFDIAMENHYF